MKYVFFFFLFISSQSIKAQTGSEIYLLDLEIKNNRPFLSNPVNITNHKGYDNQPFFHPSKPIVYYSSFTDSGRSDIMYYNYTKAKTIRFTETREREYSPTVTPDGKFISCIIQRDNGAQDLGKYPIKSGLPIVLINTLKVGYHVWVDAKSLLLFVLEDSGRNALHYYNLSAKKDTVLATNPGRSLHKIPGSGSISFIHKNTKSEWLIKKFNPITKQVSLIGATLPGKEDICWLTDKIIISSDGAGLFYYDTTGSTGWQPIPIENNNTHINGISRLTVNSTHTKLAVVISE